MFISDAHAGEETSMGFIVNCGISSLLREVLLCVASDSAVSMPARSTGRARNSLAPNHPWTYPQDDPAWVVKSSEDLGSQEMKNDLGRCH